MPVIARVVEEEHYEGRIMVPLTDGKRLFQIVVSARQAYDTGCRCIVKEWQQHVVLHTIDELRKDHLRQLDDLRQSVRNASYEQKDPLVIYKVESFHLFEQMLNELNVKAISTLMRGQIYTPQQPGASQGVPPQQPSSVLPSSPPRAQHLTLPQPRLSPLQLRSPLPPLKPAPKVERAMPEAPSAANPNMRASKEAYPGEAAMRARCLSSAG